MDININIIKENSFGDRIKYYKKERNKQLKEQGKKLIKNSDIAICIEEIYGYDSINTFLYRKKSPHKKEAFEKLAKLLNIPPICLCQDTGIHWRYLSRLEHLNNGEEFIDNSLDINGNYCIYGDIDIDSYIKADEEFIFKLQEYNDNLNSFDSLIREIRNTFFQMNLLSCYILKNYIQIYLKVEEHAWSFICNFTSVNETGKAILKETLFQTEFSIEHHLLNFKNIKPFFDFLDIINNDYLTLKKEYSIFINNNSNSLLKKQASLWHKLKKILKKQNWDDIERILRQMDIITTMDTADLTILISYFSLPSEQQKSLLTLSEELIRDIQYCDEAELFIKE